MQYQQDCHTNAHYVGGVTYYLNSKHTTYLAQLCGRFFLRFGKFTRQICESCGATYRRNYEMFSALQSISGPLTDGDNGVQIDD